MTTTTPNQIRSPSSTTTSTTLFWFLIFAVIRLVNVVVLIQSQFDPDEYWQNLEPSYCHIFWNNDNHMHSDDDGHCPGMTWEWTRRRHSTSTSSSTSSWTDLFHESLEGPVRSYASIVPTLVLYGILRHFQWDTRWTVAQGPVLLNAVLVAAGTDTCVWYASRWMDDDDEEEEEEETNTRKTTNNQTTFKTSRGHASNLSLAFWCTYCSLSSWFNAYTLVRTYSNSLETVLLALALILVGPELLRSSPSSSSSSSSLWSYATARACLAFFLGGICSAIRFTCLTAFVPMGILLAFQHQNNNTKTWWWSSVVTYLLGVCAVFGLLGLGATVVLDRVMYGFWAVPVLGNFHFNVTLGNGSLYGTHPFHWYFTAGIPALTGMLLPVLVYDFFSARTTTCQRRLWIIISCYVVAHSTSAHKEFRFLLPILPMFCLLAGTRLRAWTRRTTQSWKLKLLLMSGILINLIAVLYLGLVHQRAPIDVNRAIVQAAVASSAAAKSKSSSNSKTYRIHYLMGCHSTPLLSHLHSSSSIDSDPEIRFDPWYLDCSPNCRADPNKECESDAFSRDPRRFVDLVYGLPNDSPMECLVDGGETCEAHLQALVAATPDFVVCYSRDLDKIRQVLHLMGMEERERFVHGINGLRLGDKFTVGAGAFANDEFATIHFPYSSLELSLEEMVLFKKKTTK